MFALRSLAPAVSRTPRADPQCRALGGSDKCHGSGIGAARRASNRQQSPRRFAALTKQHSPIVQVDFIKIDVDGAEPLVLQGNATPRPDRAAAAAHTCRALQRARAHGRAVTSESYTRTGRADRVQTDHSACTLRSDWLVRRCNGFAARLLCSSVWLGVSAGGLETIQARLRTQRTKAAVITWLIRSRSRGLELTSQASGRTRC